VRRRSRAGLTLLEIVVAITLLSLLSVGMLTALRVGVNGWQRSNQSLMLDRRIASSNQLLQAALENILAARGAYRQPQIEGSQTFIFFEGQPGTMRFVTSYSLERGPRGGLRLLELLVADGPRGKRLLLNDFPYDGPEMTIPLVLGVTSDGPTGQRRMLFAPVMAQPSSFIVADELQTCSFSYYQQDRPALPGQWVPEWARDTQLPLAVRVEMAGRGDSARLRPVSVTAPIRGRLEP
jgi:general secretion pathway protein J